MNSWKTLLPMLALTAGFVVAVQVLANEPAETVEKAKLRVGTFDSRAVLFAYVDSDIFRNELKSAREEHEKAKKAGDTAKVNRIEAEQKARQARVHRQRL